MGFVSGRALREMEPAAKTYGKLVRLSQDAVEGKDIAEEQMTVTDALDTMVKWFCIPIASVLAGAALQMFGSTILLVICAAGFTITAILLLINRHVKSI